MAESAHPARLRTYKPTDFYKDDDARCPVGNDTEVSSCDGRSGRDGTRTGSRRSPAPTVANMIEGGKTPVLPQEHRAPLVFQMILSPLADLFAAAHSIETVEQRLKAEGSTLEDVGRLMTFAEFNVLIGVAERSALAERFGAASAEA